MFEWKPALKSIVLCGVITLLIYTFLYRLSASRQQEHLQYLTKHYQQAFEAINDQHQKIADILFTGFSRKGDVVDIFQRLQDADIEVKDRLRKLLHQKLRPRYEDIQATSGVRQMQFLLKNNESFLRLHSPDHYGDNLSTFRRTIAYVNKEHRPISGYEAGRIFSGYRFAKPLRSPAGEHLGCMEITFGPASYAQALMTQQQVLCNFFLREDIVERKTFKGEKDLFHTESPHAGYLFDKSVVAALEKRAGVKLPQLSPEPKISAQISHNGQQHQPMALLLPNLQEIVITLPVHNPVTKEHLAYFTIRVTDKFFLHERTSTRFAFILSVVLIVAFGVLYGLATNQVRMQRLYADERSRQQKHYQKLLSVASDAVFIMDTNGNLLDFSNTVKNLLGYSEEELRGMSVMTWDQDMTENDFKDTVSSLTTTPLLFERIHTRKDGTTYNAQITATLMTLNGESIVYASVRDITEQINSQKKILALKQDLETILESSPLAACRTFRPQNVKLAWS